MSIKKWLEKNAGISFDDQTSGDKSGSPPNLQQSSLHYQETKNHDDQSNYDNFDQIISQILGNNLNTLLSQYVKLRERNFDHKLAWDAACTANNISESDGQRFLFHLINQLNEAIKTVSTACKKSLKQDITNYKNTLITSKSTLEAMLIEAEKNVQKIQQQLNSIGSQLEDVNKEEEIMATKVNTKLQPYQNVLDLLQEKTPATPQSNQEEETDTTNLIQKTTEKRREL